MRYFLDVASCVAHMLLRDLARSLYSPLFLAPAFVVIISRHVFSCSWGVIGRRSFIFYLAFLCIPDIFPVVSQAG